MMVTRHKPLNPTDARVVEAAKGWCELHAFDEAKRELRQINPENQRHPEVLEALWQILMNLERWEQAREAATSIRSLEPGQPEGWIHSANSLVTLGRIPEALQILEEAVEVFPDDEIINYDLANVCCLLGRIQLARRCLARAVELGGDEVKLKALDDPDLGPIWRSENE
jgi:predicted Zn-dependent protease